MAAAHLLPSLAQAQQSDDTSSGTSPLVTKAPATKTQTEAAPSFDAKFSAAAMSNNIFRGYTLSNNLPSVTGTVEATYSIFFASVNGASVQIPELSHFQMTNTIGLRPEFGKLTVEGGVGYYTYPGSQVDESYAELYVAPTYAVTPKLTLGLSVYYGPNYYRTGAWENYDAVNGKYDFGHGLTLSAELGRQSFGTTADTPPIKLPDYIYGHVGATYTYNALSFGSALPRHDAVATKLSQEAWPGAEHGWESLREPRSKRRKASAPRYGAQPRPMYQQAATFVDAARRMVGMRLSALRLPLIAGGESILVRGRSSSSGA